VPSRNIPIDSFGVKHHKLTHSRSFGQLIHVVNIHQHQHLCCAPFKG